MPIDATLEISRRREAARAELEKQGLDLPRKPVFDRPRLTARITGLTDEQLIEKMVQFTRYHEYASGCLAEAEIDESKALEIVELAKAKYLVASWTGASNERVAIAKAEAIVDENVQAATEVYEQCRAYRKLLGVMAETFARDGAVVSRELTRRIGRDPQERRGDRWRP